MTETAPRKSDLGVRVLSAVMMVAVAGAALWLGGWPFAIFVTIIAVGVFWEWWDLVLRFATRPLSRVLWIAGGLGYIFLAAVTLIVLRRESLAEAILVLLLVIAVDVGAYFAGRTIGGPKIAPKISPSKTWAGLIGGATASAVVILIATWSWHSGLCEFLIPPFEDPTGTRVQFDGPCSLELPPPYYLLTSSAVAGAVIAVLAQTGDFFESWMKRKAGVKDSGTLLPGHGGLFDRTDGLIAVLFVLGLFSLYSFFASL